MFCYADFIGIVFQNHNLIPQLTALENILVPTVMCAREDHTYEEHLKKLVAALDLENRLHHLPSELSGGQQQRVALARALCAAEKMLVLDDPVAGLDKQSVADIYELIYDLNRQEGITVVTVTEDISAALKYATKILRVDKDSVFFGAPEELAALIGIDFN